MANHLENARDYDTAIEIISPQDCERGMYFLQFTLMKMFIHPDDFSLVPIKNGGTETGERLSRPAQGIHYEVNPMQMSNYNKLNKRLNKPRLIHLPNLKKILKSDGVTKNVVFAEAVVDTQHTILAAIAETNQGIDKYNKDYKTNYSYPEYHTFALVSKINGTTQIPNLVYAYDVDSRIWVYGRGCDSGERGREERSIKGYLSPFATSIPGEPYSHQSAALAEAFLA